MRISWEVHKGMNNKKCHRGVAIAAQYGKTEYVIIGLNVGNAVMGREQVLTPVMVTKVGRKYFTATRDANYRHLDVEYHLGDWGEKTEYCVNSVLYESEQEWLDEKEAGAICDTIYKAFEYGRNRLNLPLESLRRIAEIINAKKEAGV